MPPLTDSEESEIDEESEGSYGEEDTIINARCLSYEPSQKSIKVKKILTRKKSSPRNIPPGSMSKSRDGPSDSDTESGENADEQ